METKIFSEIPGFSFEHTVYKDWEVKRIEKVSYSKYIIFLNYSNSIDFETAPQITVEKLSELGLNLLKGTSEVPTTILKKNPNDVSYDLLKSTTNTDTLQFYTNDFGVRITPFIHEGDGYSSEEAINQMIDSFKLTDTRQTN